MVDLGLPIELRQTKTLNYHVVKFMMYWTSMLGLYIVVMYYRVYLNKEARTVCFTKRAVQPVIYV